MGVRREERTGRHHIATSLGRMPAGCPSDSRKTGRPGSTRRVSLHTHVQAPRGNASMGNAARPPQGCAKMSEWTLGTISGDSDRHNRNAESSSLICKPTRHDGHHFQSRERHLFARLLLMGSGSGYFLGLQNHCRW